MRTLLAVILDGVRQLAAAVPDAWRGDRVFRWAIVGSGLTLGSLLLSHSHGRLPKAPPGMLIQPAASLTAPSPLPMSEPAAEPTYIERPGRSPLPMPAVPVIAPGQPLGAAVVQPVSPDSFGTISPARKP